MGKKYFFLGTILACLIGWATINWLWPNKKEDNPVCIFYPGYTMTATSAREIARASTCQEVGQLKETQVCNTETGTWWIDIKPYEPKEGCSPACVVKVQTAEAEVNWRCTGLKR